MTAEDERVAQITAWFHAANGFNYDECPHGTYAGGPSDGEPYAMCERFAQQLIADNPDPRVRELEAEKAEAERRIAEAPHSAMCHSHFAVGFPSREFHACDCWKSRSVTPPEEPSARGNAEWETRKALAAFFDPETIEEILADLRSVTPSEEPT